jgi:hypothetical protein
LGGENIQPVAKPLDERIARNEAIFRDVNEALKRGRWPGDQGAIPFRCECARLGCSTLIDLTSSEYEHIRAHPKWFVVATGHEAPEGEAVVETHGAHLVVEKLGEAGVVAEATDPRSRY